MEAFRKRFWGDFLIQFVLMAFIVVVHAIVFPAGPTFWNMILPAIVIALVISAAAVDIWRFEHPSRKEWIVIALTAVGLLIADYLVMLLLLFFVAFLIGLIVW